MITVEVNKQQEQHDIFIRGNYVEGLKNDAIILVTDSEGDEFNGVVVREALGVGDTGTYYTEIKMRDFTQFTGTITITSK